MLIVPLRVFTKLSHTKGRGSYLSSSGACPHSLLCLSLASNRRAISLHYRLSNVNNSYSIHSEVSAAYLTCLGPLNLRYHVCVSVRARPPLCLAITLTWQFIFVLFCFLWDHNRWKRKTLCKIPSQNHKETLLDQKYGKRLCLKVVHLYFSLRLWNSGAILMHIRPASVLQNTTKRRFLHYHVDW